MLCHLKFSGAVFLFFWQRLSISSPSSPSLVLDFVAINWCGSQPWVSETSGGGALWELYEVDLTQMEKLWMYNQTIRDNQGIVALPKALVRSYPTRSKVWAWSSLMDKAEQPFCAKAESISEMSQDDHEQT